MRLYLAGPMRGLPEHNFPAFAGAAARLRAAGHEVFSPHEMELDVSALDGTEADGGRLSVQGFSLRRALREDLSWVCLHAEGVALLPGWEASLGACAEFATARALGIPARPVEVWVEKEALASAGQGHPA